MNTNTNNTPGDPADKAELYALGLLSPREAEEFEAKVLAGEVDAEALEEHLQTMTALCEEIAQVMPTPRRAVKDAIMAAIAPPASQSEPGGDASGQIFLFAKDGEWVEMMPGITMKVLHHDVEHERTTFLVRLAPGAQYPSHRHMGLEECLVIEGDLHVDGNVLRSGDFTATYSDKVHVDTHSEEGCLLLISSPMNDEFLEG